MRFNDLQKEYEHFAHKISPAVSEVMHSGNYLFGSQLAELESSFAKMIGTKHAIGVKNCTDAIMLILKAVYKKGMTVILPNFGAYPTAVAVKNITKNIHYVDVDLSLTIDPKDLPVIKNGIVICVHLFGTNCNMVKIKEYCDRFNHILIEDCAQSTGSGSGAVGDYSVFSFYPTKPLASMGDGGMICTNNDRTIFDAMRFYGWNNGQIDVVGINSRMDEIQCAIVNSKMDGFQELNNRRIAIANRYKQIIRGTDSTRGSVYHQFVVLFRKRSLILKKMEEKKIPYMIHYKKHVEDMHALRTKNGLGAGFRVSDKCVSLPCHPFMTDSEIQMVEEFLEKCRGYEYAG